MSESPFIEIEHTADWSLLIRAQNMEGLLMNASSGMFELMQLVRGEQRLGERRLTTNGHDREELLVSWLEELLFHIETRGVALVVNQISLSEDQRNLEARVDEYAIASLEKEIKAVTYHELRIRETKHGMEATVVFDV